MIGYLRGILIAKTAPMLLIDVSGIGYELMMPVNSFHLLPNIGEEVTLHTHFIVRENEQALYGFIDEKQKALFRDLIKVNGIGPKSALTILSGSEIAMLVKNILSNEISDLIRLPGIGEKTAKRLVIEMKDKIEANYFDFISEQDRKEIDPKDISVALKDAISALVSLGYKPQQAQKTIFKHKDKNLSSEELIRLALKEI